MADKRNFLGSLKLIWCRLALFCVQDDSKMLSTQVKCKKLFPYQLWFSYNHHGKKGENTFVFYILLRGMNQQITQSEK